MKKKDELIIKIGKSVIVVFGVLAVFNFIMLINKKSYALFQKTIETDNVIRIKTADKLPSENSSIDELKEKTSDGMQGMDPKTGTECSGTECPEYRYVGTSVNNYVTFNGETWRIVGIFKDENDVEHLKIVRNNVLTADMFPETYTVSGTEYKIKYTSGDNAYWNNKTSGTDNNDWTTAGLRYYLNTEQDSGSNLGYLSRLSAVAKGMIANTVYYLGSYKYASSGDTPITAYEHERAVSECSSNKGPTTNNSESTVEGNSSCRVLANNTATWTGKIGLLYPSDYGFSANSSNWSSVLYNYESNSRSSWLQQEANHTDDEWLLSPSTRQANGGIYWDQAGGVSFNVVNTYNGVRPCLYLKSEVQIIDGTGEETNPYQLAIN